VQIGLQDEAEEYSKLFSSEKYVLLKDLVRAPPNKDDLKEFGIVAARDRILIWQELQQFSNKENSHKNFEREENRRLKQQLSFLSEGMSYWFVTYQEQWIVTHFLGVHPLLFQLDYVLCEWQNQFQRCTFSIHLKYAKYVTNLLKYLYNQLNEQVLEPYFKIWKVCLFIIRGNQNPPPIELVDHNPPVSV
jgi:hypothetical protein